jgi:hypothetical protein
MIKQYIGGTLVKTTSVEGVETLNKFPIMPETAPDSPQSTVTKAYVDSLVVGPATLEIVQADLTDSKYTFASRVTILNIYSNTGDVVLADITVTSNSTVIDFSHVTPLTDTWVIEYFSTLNTANIVTDDTLTGSGTAADPLGVVPMASPIYINMLTTAPSAVGQGTWVKIQLSTLLFAGVFYNSSAANGDNFSVNFAAFPGVYTIELNTSKSADRGKLDVFLDDEKIIDAVDLYAASANQISTTSVTSVEISAGIHALKFALNGKNASSSSHNFSVQGISLTRTGEIV